MRFLTPLLLTASLALPFAALADTSQITVTGEGSVYRTPDLATVTIGVTTEKPTAVEALRANSEEMAKVTANLKTAGIGDRDLQTSGLSVNPNWSNSYDSSAAPKIAGYVAANVLTVRVRALDGLGAVLDAAVTDGANTLNGVSFGLADPDPVMNDARKLAVADARARAELLTAAAGVTLGKIVSITESAGAVDPQPMFRQAADSAAVPVSTGEVGVTAMVTIIWEIKD